MKRSLVLFLVFCGVIACGPSTDGPAGDNAAITVSAAVSLKDVFNEIGVLYKARTGSDAAFNFGASGNLQRQIEAGAPSDVFASAGSKQMDELAAKGLIDDGSRRDMAANTLVLVVPSGLRLTIAGFSDLANAEVKRIAVGNPKTVPAGQYTEQVFTRSGIKQGLEPKLILAEDVRQVLDYVKRGEVDAGIVYATDAQIAGDRVRVAATAPDGGHDPILYPIAVIKDTKNKRAASQFVDTVMSPEGQAILEKYGFRSAGGAAR